MIKREVRRGDIYWFDFGMTKGSEQGGVRPAVVIQNNVGNRYSPTIIVSIISSEIKKNELPTHVYINEYEKCGLKRPSQVMAEQVKTVDKSKIGDYIGSLNKATMDKINKAIEISVQVGSANDYVEPREVKETKRKAREIEEIDQFLRMWFSKNNDMTRVQEYIKDREIMIKDLELYAKNYGLDYRNFYKPMVNNLRMVG